VKAITEKPNKDAAIHDNTSRGDDFEAVRRKQHQVRIRWLSA
jgi:hypothetical protein